MILIHFKGLCRHGDMLTTSLTSLYLAQWFLLFGQMDGYYRYADSLETDTYQWDLEFASYHLLFWLVSLTAWWLILYSKECIEFKIGGIIGYMILPFVSVQILYAAVSMPEFIPACNVAPCENALF